MTTKADHMRIFITTLLMLLIPYCVIAQLGYEVDLTRHTYKQLDGSLSSVPDVDITSFGVQVGCQYWFRLKRQRVEFIPGFHIAADLGTQSEFHNYGITNVQGIVAFPVLIYPFSFKDDCNCPTFKKQGNVINKGLHLIIHTSATFNKRNVEHDSVSTNTSAFVPSIGIGAGLDLGISRILTLTPFIIYQKYIRDKLETIENHEVIVSHESLNIGVRLRITQNRRKY